MQNWVFGRSPTLNPGLQQLVGCWSMCIICVMLIMIVIHVSYACVAHMWQSGGYPMPVRGGMVLNNRVCPNWMGADHMSVGTLGDDHGPVDGDLPASDSNTCDTATLAILAILSLDWVTRLNHWVGLLNHWEAQPVTDPDDRVTRLNDSTTTTAASCLSTHDFLTVNYCIFLNSPQPAHVVVVILINLSLIHLLCSSPCWISIAGSQIVISSYSSCFAISAYHEHFLQILWEDLALLLIIINILLQTSF